MMHLADAVMQVVLNVGLQAQLITLAAAVITIDNSRCRVAESPCSTSL